MVEEFKHKKPGPVSKWKKKIDNTPKGGIVKLQTLNQVISFCRVARNEGRSPSRTKAKKGFLVQLDCKRGAK
jgi:hypothetical protein